jgi:two-component system heavy metal sensor histidine kinase CusS
MRRYAGSLTLQLAGLFAVVAAAVFATVGFYLVQALVSQLRERDDADLLDRVAYIRHLLEETATANSVKENPHRFLDAVDLRGGMLLEIRTGDGRLLTRNANISRFASSPSDVIASRQPQMDDVRDTVSSDGLSVRVLRAAGQVGNSADVVHITLAHMAEARAALLSAYRLKVFVAVTIGALGFLGPEEA